jgi:crotonobetainyl-CoA:carnitine CoA-transferase CaiB-like acyl-CoA transferase
MNNKTGNTPNESLLEGYRVLDLTEGGCQICGKVLGDMGADVIKIEPPGGSPSRKTGPFYKDDPDPEKSLFWMACNTSKRGVTLNIEHPKGLALFKKLLDTADVVVESFRPGYMQGLGLEYSDMDKIKPGIIMTSITPFGQTGPFSHYKGSDIVVWAMGGMLGLCGDNDRPPVQHSHPQAYYHGGLQGAVGTMVALYHKEISGEGQHVDVSMQQAVLLTLMNAAEIGDLLKITHPRPNPDGTFFTPRSEEYGPIRLGIRWECKDGHIAWSQGLSGGAQSGMVRSTKEIVNWMVEEGMADDLTEYDWSKFDSSIVPQKLLDHHFEVFSRFFRTKTKRELMDRAAAKGIVLGAYQTTRDIAECPHLNDRNYFVDVEHAELGRTIAYPGAWAKFSEAPWRISRRAPLIGEHNQEIYEKELGISREQISQYRELGIL